MDSNNSNNSNSSSDNNSNSNDNNIYSRETFDEILSDEVSYENVLTMFENLRMSYVSEEDQVSHFYMVMRNPAIVGCIGELLYMYVNSKYVHKAICSILDGWLYVKGNLSAIAFRMYATPLLVQTIRNAINVCITNLQEKEIDYYYYSILQRDFRICLYHIG